MQPSLSPQPTLLSRNPPAPLDSSAVQHMDVSSNIDQNPRGVPCWLEISALVLEVVISSKLFGLSMLSNNPISFVEIPICPSLPPRLPVDRGCPPLQRNLPRQAIFPSSMLAAAPNHGRYGAHQKGRATISFPLLAVPCGGRIKTEIGLGLGDPYVHCRCASRPSGPAASISVQHIVSMWLFPISS